MQCCATHHDSIFEFILQVVTRNQTSDRQIFAHCHIAINMQSVAERLVGMKSDEIINRNSINYAGREVCGLKVFRCNLEVF